MGAQLQSVSLDKAQLQGAWLFFAQLQGASLDEAQLQGAWLFFAQLQGASLDKAQLQGAWLDNAQLQGASLNGAQLQAASLNKAQLQGASLNEARLQGASLDKAQLQGASLAIAQLQDASLAGAYLWRANWGILDLNAIKPIRFARVKWDAVNPRFDGSKQQDEPWTDRAYDDLRDTIEKEVPQGAARDSILERIARLDCKKSGDDLASCHSRAKPPPAVTQWRELLEGAQAGEATYAKALAQRLRVLVCSVDANAIHILRGVSNGFFPRLEATGHEAPALIDDILAGNNCAISTALTDADRARLQEIKAEALKKYPPAPAPALAKEQDPSPTASPPAPPVKTPAKSNRRRSARDRPPP